MAGKCESCKCRDSYPFKFPCDSCFENVGENYSMETDDYYERDREMLIKIKMLADIEPPKAISNGDWIDLRTAEDVLLSEGQFKLIKLGVAIELPKGYEALLIPRSSTYKKHHIIQTNSVGLIDESYCGDGDEWMMPVYATEDTFIPKGTRICQFRIIEHQPEIGIEIVDILGNENRNGFGSTGEK